MYIKLEMHVKSDPLWISDGSDAGLIYNHFLHLCFIYLVCVNPFIYSQICIFKGFDDTLTDKLRY